MTSLEAGTKLGPYEILAPIGAGGMGEVYKARDTRLGRIVAIKKVKEQHSERFKQEARSIAALNHSFICQLYDIGPDFLVLEYVEGKPLSSPLPEKEAVRLAIQIATALEEAHRNGVIHRDLKPSNIMVTDKGSVKLLDFGLAKLYEQDAALSTSPTADFPPTQAGAVLGTVAYMSPEQAQGKPADARSDIFSFGLVLYEMLSGRRAFAGDSAPEILAALLRDEAPPLHTSPMLEKIVRQCLAKQPSGRYQTMSEVRTALEQVSAERVTAGSAETQPSIGVLPFVNMSGDKEQEYFSDGLAEEIINALTQIPGLKVTARTSAFAFRGKEQDIRNIAETLGVRAILEGSVRKSGNRIRVSAQLINAADGYHLWSERYDRDLTDIFAIQDEISQAIAEKLRVRLSGDRPLVKPYTRNMEAYNLYLKGRHQFVKFTPEALAKSKSYYEQALAMDPDYALAWSELAGFNLVMGGIYGYIRPAEAYRQCSHAIEKALELDATLPQIDAYRASLHAFHYEWEEAMRSFRRALEHESRVSDIAIRIYYCSWYLLPQRRFEEALALLRETLELDPLSVWTQWLIAWCLYMDRQYERTIEQCHVVLDLDPHYYLAHQYLGFACLETGQWEEGVRACERAAEIVGKGPWPLAFRAIAFAKTGRADQAKPLLEDLHQMEQKSYVSRSIFAWIYSAMGEIDKALDWFEKCVEGHDTLVLLARDFALFDPLRSRPRYHALLRKMNLE